MWGARDSESRRPSRTTSWSSTIRAVISLVTGVIVSRFAASDGQSELLWLLRRLQLHAAAVADAVLSRQAGDFLADRRGLFPGQIGAAVCVEPLVAVELLRPVLGKVLEKVLSGAGL